MLPATNSPYGRFKAKMRNKVKIEKIICDKMGPCFATPNNEILLVRLEQGKKGVLGLRQLANFRGQWHEGLVLILIGSVLNVQHQSSL